MRRLRQWRGLLQPAALVLVTAAALRCERLMDTGMGVATFAGIVALAWLCAALGAKESPQTRRDVSAGERRQNGGPDGASATRVNGQTALHE